ncbi:MAG: 4-hydroxythreonine-4-phosphate dehydrogenase PdxA [bacterium]
MKNSKKIAITMGDPSGVGPEIILKALNSNEIDKDNLILIGNKDVFIKFAKKHHINADFNLEFIEVECDLSKLKMGIPTEESGRSAFLALEKACELANENSISAIATAPLSKKAINLAGYCYSGQTEVLKTHIKSLTKHNQPEMLFVANDFKVMLLTRHVELSNLCELITQDKIINSVLNLNKSLINDFGIESPKIAICGLNPHAGEDGLLGREEVEIFIPAIQKLKEIYKINISGPFPGDTIWVNAGRAFLKQEKLPFDAYISSYHDQGLIPIKLLAMDECINTTINLPIIRTSPSHGTAYDIAGKNIANPQSMIESIKLANMINSNRGNLLSKK